MNNIRPRDLPENHRKDLDHVDDANEHPSQEAYGRYVHLCEQCKKARYNDDAIDEVSDFLVKDPTSSVLLYLSNQALVEIGERISEDTAEIEEWLARTREGID